MVKVGGDVDIAATPEEVLDVLADLPRYPEWSAVHKRASIDRTSPGGRPQRATMGVAAAGLVDTQVLDYEWSDTGLSWSLVKATAQSAQHGSYRVEALPGGGSHVRYDLDIVPAIPVPGFLVRRVMRNAVTAATEGLRARVESLP